MDWFEWDTSFGDEVNKAVVVIKCLVDFGFEIFGVD